MPKADIESRQPANLAETLEQSRASRGLPRARLRFRLFAASRTAGSPDSDRRSSRELGRRAGPSATYLDRFVLGGVEVSRGPGSVAYGSGRFRRRHLAGTRDASPGAPLHVEATGDYGLGFPAGALESPSRVPCRPAGGILVAGHYRSYGNYDSPLTERCPTPATDSGVLASARHTTLGPGTLTGAGRATTRGRSPAGAEIADHARLFPEENSSVYRLVRRTPPRSRRST